MAPTNWGVPRGHGLLWREWGGHFVVFNPRSGDTHFLNALAATVLEFLEAEPATFDDVVGHVEQLSETKLEAGAIDQIRELVAKFDEVGLIVPCRR